MAKIINNKLLVDKRWYYPKFVLGITSRREEEYYHCVVEIFEDSIFIGRLVYLPYYKEAQKDEEKQTHEIEIETKMCFCASI